MLSGCECECEWVSFEFEWHRCMRVVEMCLGAGSVAFGGSMFRFPKSDVTTRYCAVMRVGIHDDGCHHHSCGLDIVVHHQVSHELPLRLFFGLLHASFQPSFLPIHFLSIFF